MWLRRICDKKSVQNLECNLFILPIPFPSRNCAISNGWKRKRPVFLPNMGRKTRLSSPEIKKTIFLKKFEEKDGLFGMKI